MNPSAIYSQIEEKWYSLLDAIDSKGIPVYKVIDPIENAGIPSLPLVAGVAIILIALVAYTLSVSPAASPGGFTVSVADISGSPIKGATVNIIRDAETLYSKTTNSKGEAYFSLEPNKRYQAEAKADLCGSDIELVDTSEMDSLGISLTCKSPEMAGCSSLTEDKLVTQLTDDQNNIPSACVLRVYNSNNESVDTPFEVSSSGLLDISKGGNCPTDDDRVLIDCQYQKWEGTVAGMYNELGLFGQLTLAVKEGATPNTASYPPAEITRDIYVKVQNTQGTPLEGISVKAVDASGEPLYLDFDGLTLESTTDATGTAKLVFPDQQEFQLNLNDPNGAYHAYTSASSYKATLTQSQSPIVLNMDSGFDTTIYVKEEARQTAIGGATVAISSDSRVVATGTTGADGTFTTPLLKGAQYSVNIQHPLYFAASADIAGGADKSIFLSPIDETKTGTVVVDVSNAHGLQEEFPGVRVKLYSQSNNTLWMSAIAPADGRCVFSKVKQGTYYITATPPGAITEQAFQPFQVSPQNTTVQKISVVPNQLTLTVLTKVKINDNAVRKKDVEVTLWNADYYEPVETKKSGSTRKVEFTLDRGTRYFLVAEYVDSLRGTKYGPLETAPAVLAQSRKTTLTLTQVSEEANIIAPSSIAKGGKATVKLRLSLPEYRPGKMYKSASIEMFVGEPGSVKDIRRTPIVIQPIYLSDIASQEPFVSSVTKADTYSYDKQPTADDKGTSKYVRVDIGHYTAPTIYEVAIPIYARELAKSGDVKISYRATWEPPEGDAIKSNKGLWSEKTIKITGSEEVAKPLDSGSFYSYSAYFTKQINGDAIPSPSVPEGSLFYLHINAKARSSTTNWKMDISNLPDKAVAVSYSGKILRASGTSVDIAEFPLSGPDFTIENSEAAYSLEKDDELLLTVALRGAERGKGTLTLFGDYDNSLAYKITRKARTGPTPIAGVTATLTASSNFCVLGYDNGLTQSGSCYYDYPEGLALPTNNKDFKLTLEMDGNATANVLIEAADQSIKFDDTSSNYYEAVVEAPKTLVITGHGTSAAANTMSVYIWEQGSTKPNEPWKTITYGPVDYSLSVAASSGGMVEATPTEQTDELQIKITRREGQQEEIVGNDVLDDNKADVSIGGVRGKAALVLFTEPYFDYQVDPLNPPRARDGIKVTANSPLFGKLVYETDVSGLIFDPTYPEILFQSPVALGSAASDKITITSSWKEPVELKLSSLSREGWDIATTAKTFSSLNVPMETTTGSKPVTIPPEGRAEISIAATAKDVKCRLDIKPTILEIESDAMAKAAHYTLGLQCNVQEGAAVSAPELAGYVAREALPPEKITMDSCSASGDGTYAFVCDSEQLSMAIAKAGDALLDSPTSTKDVRFYAFGNDELSAAIMDTAIKENSKSLKSITNVLNRETAAMQAPTHDLVTTGNPTCGIVQVNLTKINMDEDVNVTFSVNSENADWCNTDSTAYAIGLMNFDKDLRPGFGKYMSFSGDYEKFLGAIQKAREQGSDISPELLFGYEPGSKDRAGTQAASVFNYRECERKSSSDCPGFAVKSLSNDHPIIGYYHVTDQNDIVVGIVYDENKIVGAGGAYTQIPAYRTVFAKALMNYIMTDQHPGWLAPTGSFQSIIDPQYYPLADTLLDLTGPEIVKDSFKLYGFSPDGQESDTLVGNRSINLQLEVTGEPAFCVISNIDAGGQPLDEVKSDQIVNDVLAIPWELPSGSGSKLVSAYCVDENGVPSHKVRARITLDETPMELVRPLPRMVTTSAPVVQIPKFKDTSINVRDRFSDVTYCELRLAGKEMPNIEKCDDNNDGVFDPSPNGPDSNDSNANGEWKNGIVGGEKVFPGTNIDSYKDGCCVVTPTETAGLYYNNAKVNCWSPYITDNDKATDVELWCRDNSSSDMVSLGKISIWKYSNEKPQFDVPDDFVMSTSELGNPLDKTFFFNEESIPYGVKGRIEWNDKFAFEPTNKKGLFNYEFTVSDMDGIDPNSGCSVEVQAHTEDYTGKPPEGYDSNGKPSDEHPVTQRNPTCTGEPTTPGSLREVHMTCPVQLEEKAVNNVTITCTDLSDHPEDSKISHSFEWTWDEEGPVLSNLEMNSLGSMWGDLNNPQRRDMAPTISFIATDNYSEIGGCNARLNFEADVADYFSYACKMQDTDEKLKNKMKIVCDYKSLTNDSTAQWPLLFIDMSNPVTLDCWDEVANPTVKDAKEIKKDYFNALPASNISDIVVKACKMIREDTSHDEIVNAGFYDLGEEEGSVEVKEPPIGKPQMDEDGVMAVVAVSDGSITNKAIREALNKKLKGMDIPRVSLDCASRGLCLGAIQAAVHEAAVLSCPETGGEGCAEVEGKAINEETEEGVDTAKVETAEEMPKETEKALENEASPEVKTAQSTAEKNVANVQKEIPAEVKKGTYERCGKEYTYYRNVKTGRFAKKADYEKWLEYKGAPVKASKTIEEEVASGKVVTLENYKLPGWEDTNEFKLETKVIDTKAGPKTQYRINNMFAKEKVYKEALEHNKLVEQQLAEAGKNVVTKGEEVISEVPVKAPNRIASVLKNSNSFLSRLTRLTKYGVIATFPTKATTLMKMSLGAMYVVRGIAVPAIDNYGAELADVASKYKIGEVCKYSDEGNEVAKGLGAIGEGITAALCPGCLALKIGIPDNWNALVCSPDKMAGSKDAPKRYIITAKAGRVDLGAAGGILGTLSVCTDSCNDYICSVTISEEPPSL